MYQHCYVWRTASCGWEQPTKADPESALKLVPPIGLSRAALSLFALSLFALSLSLSLLASVSISIAIFRRIWKLHLVPEYVSPFEKGAYVYLYLYLNLCFYLYLYLDLDLQTDLEAALGPRIRLIIRKRMVNVITSLHQVW